MARRNRFVIPETVRIDLSGEDWIDIKKKLTVGETRRMQLGGIKMVGKAGQPEMEVSMDIEALSLAKVTVYLLDWSFEDAEGRRVDLSRQSIEALDEASYQEISDAIDEHTKAMDKEKKITPKNTGSRLKTISH
jgi:hypothetical protein